MSSSTECGAVQISMDCETCAVPGMKGSWFGLADGLNMPRATLQDSIDN